MSQVGRHARLIHSFTTVAWLAVTACTEPVYRDVSQAVQETEPQPEPTAGVGDRDAGTVVSASVDASSQMAGAPAPVLARCLPAHASDKLRARSSAMASLANQNTHGAAAGVFTRDLFALFRSNCGGCHVDQSQGGLHVGMTDFAKKITATALQRIRSDDPSFYMPPQGMGAKPFSKRSSDDPIVELANLIEAWLAAGSPDDVFYPTVHEATSIASDPNRYLLPPEVGVRMTNLGSCIPEPAMVGTDTSKTAELDRFFANTKQLPERLEQTDMTTFDTEELAKDGVIAFVPGYPLFSDNAKKIRMLRVPRGKSIRFDPGSQAFSIPANTRFYKTFLKRVIDLDGNESYRKIETRLILSRPDTVNADGSRTVTALFGTYAWNEQETEAVLVRDPLRDGTPFRDRLITYVLDEQAADRVIADAPKDLGKALEERKLTRTYAIPGSERCIQCHMGSAGANFILGFTPLQINRQSKGKHGFIEPVGRDELNQLQRFLDYGLVTGMDSPSDAVLLEQSEGSRKPRNDYELEAQGYVLGNCSHCHNPHGFPSVSAPELRDVLDFLPSSTGGLFEFPLERVSPRIHRGSKQEVELPYITPSLFDLNDFVGPSGNSPQSKRVLVKHADGEASEHYLYAPWRSLIYRNVDTPFTYVEDFTIFPHMPRNTPGYDCRARQILGTWMASIPARIEEGTASNDDQEVGLTGGIVQPYVEVKAGDEAYDAALRDAQSRVESFQTGPRYNDCPAPELDLVDPSVRDNPGVILAPKSTYVDDDKWTYSLAVPERGHWFVMDLTDAPGDWYPRRSDWRDVLQTGSADYRTGERELVSLLNTTRISGNDELRKFALTAVPMTLWQEKSDCKFPSSVKTVGEIPAGERPGWLARIAPLPNDAHLYSMMPGAYVFTSICQNCHGPEADAKSRNADTIADLTGGDTRVANLRDGFLGPRDKPGENRTRVFGAMAGADLTADDWGSRYLAWMTLGGTQRTIPGAILNLVGNASVFGEKRSGLHPIETGSANMLETAKFLCREVLPAYDKWFDVATGSLLTPANSTEVRDSSALVYKNGDGELWERLCTLQNPLPVRVLRHRPGGEVLGKVVDPSFRLPVVIQEQPNAPLIYSLYARAAYGAHPVGDQRGNVQPTLLDDNAAPWCVREPDDANERADLDQYWANLHGGTGPGLPYCPPELIASAPLSDQDVLRWTQRAAMNAGFSVFLYLDALTKNDVERIPNYNECEKLSAK